MGGNREGKKRIWHLAYLGIGANRGLPILQCYQAIYQLQHMASIKVIERSSFYRTEPYGYEKQPWFINLVIKVRTYLSPRELLECAQKIEMRLGKRKKTKWGPRHIDIDILLYENRRIDEFDLKIPHPFLPSRNFVLYPLVEIAPDLRHPCLSHTIKSLLRVCEDTKEVKNIEFISR